MSNLVDYARRELDAAGIGLPDSDYDGALHGAVMELVEVFARQGHSGYSAMATLALFDRVARFQPIGLFEPRADQALEVDGDGTLQSTRRHSVFSGDRGRTWRCIDTGERWPRPWWQRVTPPRFWRWVFTMQRRGWLPGGRS